MKKILIFALISTIINSNYGQLVEYYKELIINETDKASNFVMKTDNSEYWENGEDNKIHNFGKYDFIIVGAGSAGAIVASRLAEVRKWKILVLEAGDDETDFTDIPGYWMWSATSGRAWNYLTTPQTTYCLGMKNNQCYFPAGKNVGGSSVINAMVHVRGNKGDFNRWASVHGNPGWSYRAVLPYFKKFENFSLDGDAGYHGYSGPLHIEHTKPVHNLTEVFIDAYKEMGFDVVDYNGARQIGTTQDQKVLRFGKRDTTGRRYIDPKRDQHNFKISIKSYVTKVLIDKFKKAYGVLFMKDGKKYRATAQKEVILSAGAINSAQILMLSGIGPRKHLRKMGIKVKKNLPVGQKLMDHISYMMMIDSDFVDISQTLEEQIEDFLNGQGYLTFQSDSTATTYHNLYDFTETIPEFYNKFVPTSMSGFTQPSSQKFLNYRDDVFYSLYWNANRQITHGLMVVLTHPKSLGTITLKSKNPKEFPNVNINSLSDKNNEDITNLYKGILFAKESFETTPFSEINTHVRNNSIPGCSDYEYDSKDYWFCFIRHLAYPGYHPVGTTRMGWNERDYVVDSRLRVYGIRGLRVADAGIMPELVSGNTQSTAFMIGEKAADLIKQTHL